MADIIKQWLQERLGMSVDMAKFGEIAQDGSLLTELLRSYQIIADEDYKKIKKSPKAAEDNLNKIKSWLDAAGIYVDKTNLMQMADKNDTAAVQVFYDIFLKLQGRQSLLFITDQTMENKRSKHHIEPTATMSDRFSCNTLQSYNNKAVSPTTLATPIFQANDVVHWYKDRMDMLKSKCQEARDEYLDIVKKQLADEVMTHDSSINFTRQVSTSSSLMDNLRLVHKTDTTSSKTEVELTYKQLLKKQEETRRSPSCEPDKRIANEIMKRLRVKRDEKAENRVFKDQLRRELTSALWQKIEGDPENDDNKALVEIFMKQSHYEKQMLAKIGEVNIQREIMVENHKRQLDILNKQREDEYVDNLIQKNKQIGEAKFAYYLEKERLETLHKKILQEKLKLREQRINKICGETVKDLVDVALKIAEYKEGYGIEPSKREMDKLKKVFATGQSVLDELKPVELIVTQPEDVPELIIHNEIERQDALDAKEFESYMHYEWPWNLSNIEYDPQRLEDVTCGLNVLGNIVHLVLNGKYPKPPKPEVPSFPNVTIRACIRDLVDQSFVPVLRKLLSERGVVVVQIEDVVNFCLDALKEETKEEYDELPEAEASKQSKKKEKKEKKEKKPAKGAKRGKKEAIPEEPIEEKPEPVDATNQTPLLFPCQVPELSNKAKLGQEAYEKLNNGLSLLDRQLLAMFVEYLKSIPDLKGWVLLNYPNTIEQAAFLEEAFTGINFLGNPNEIELPEYLQGSVFKRNDPEEEDGNEHLGVSMILPDPVKKDVPKIYDTVLTAYIRLKKNVNEENATSDLPPVLADIIEETDVLEKFYCDMGVSYSLYYEKFDYYTVKYLGKLAIGDYSLPLKSSLELFGDTFKYIEAEVTGDKALLKSAKKGEKKEKPKERMKLPKNKAAGEALEEENDNNKKKGKGAKPKKVGKVVITHEDKWIQVPDIEDEEEEEEPAPEEEVIPPTAGQEGWEYTVLKLPDDLNTVLSTLWENLEEVYVNDLKQVLFLKRVNLDALMPFVQFVKNFMEKCINRPDYKNNFLRRFHDAYNAFDADFRKDVEFKQEMHCRIEQFKEKLSDICDRKMMGSEEKRCQIIGDNWAPAQLVDLLNVYACAVQIEVDRCVDTMNFIKDYFTGVVTKMPPEEVIQKEIIPKYKEVNKDAVNELLKNTKSIFDLKYFENTVQIVINSALSIILKAHNSATSNFEKVKAMVVDPKNAKGGNKKPAKGDKNILAVFEPDETVKANCEKIIDEWQTAIKGEIARCHLRLDLIRTNALSTIQEFINTIKQCFHSVFQSLETKYKEEITEISKACNLIKAAVEHERPLQDELIFIDDEFKVNPEKILFPDPLPIPKPVQETSVDEMFKVYDLLTITDMLLDLAPSGYMVKASFKFMLQDLIANQADDGLDTLVPKVWQQLEPMDVADLISAMFDDLEYVQWKEFIIHNMLVQYPTEDRLIEIRRMFRTLDPDKTELIRDYQFYACELWFDHHILDKVKLNLLKNLIFKLYQVKRGTMNYTAMLLDFSKDDDPMVGFVKALEVSFGRKICHDKAEGEAFKEELLRKIKEHDDQVKERENEMEENKKLAEEVLDEVLVRTVAIADGVVIEDLEKPKDENKTIFEQIEQYMNGVEKEEPAEEDEYVESNDMEMVYYQEYDRFSNISIDFESTEFSKVYFLPFEPVLAVVTTCIPWNARVGNLLKSSLRESVEEVYRSKQDERFSNAVFAHEFINDPRLVQLLSETKKFRAVDVVKSVRGIVEGKIKGDT